MRCKLPTLGNHREHYSILRKTYVKRISP